MIIEANIDTTRQTIAYRDFVIEEAYVPSKGNVWQWAHEKYDPVFYPVGGDCQTVFECIDAVDAWHASEDSEIRKAAAA